jgi:hypothetical protein
VRTSVDRASALRKLDGHTVAGLRAIARDEGVVASSKDTKATLMERLMRVMYDRHADSQAITNMVNRDRTPASTSIVPIPDEALRHRQHAAYRVDLLGSVGAQGVSRARRPNCGAWCRAEACGSATQWSHLYQEWRGTEPPHHRPGRVTAPRANAPAAGGSITPTMTGAQLIAARRKLQAEQQGRRTQ